MGGPAKKKSSAGDIAERRRKKKKRRKTEACAVPKTCDAPKEAGTQQVSSPLNLVLHCTDSIAPKKPKKKKRLKSLQKCGRSCELPSDEASSEEKQSLLQWVEMSMERSHGDIGHGQFAKGSTSNGHTYSVNVCGGKHISSRICNEPASTAVHTNGAFNHLPNACGLKFDHEGHASDKIFTNGHNTQSQHPTKRCSSKVCNGKTLHEGVMRADVVKCKNCLTSKQINRSRKQRSTPIRQSYEVPNAESLHASCTSTSAHQEISFNGHVSRSGERELSGLVGTMHAHHHKALSNGHAVRSGEDDSSCQDLDLKISANTTLAKANNSPSLSNCANSNNNKRKREDDKVLHYVLKRSIVLHPSPFKPSWKKSRTTKSVVLAWGRNIPVTLTSEACAVQRWISSQSGNLFGLDVEWRPNRAKGEKNKVALLQLCSENECLIIQMLFLDNKPHALRQLLSDPSKGLAGVGVVADGKRLFDDHGLECQGSIELTTLAVERLKRDELRKAGLKVLMQEVLGLKMDKPKRITLSNWAKSKLDPAQINYACMDAWASFAISQKLLADM